LDLDLLLTSGRRESKRCVGSYMLRVIKHVPSRLSLSRILVSKLVCV